MKLGLPLATGLLLACASGSVDSSPTAPRGSRDAETPVADMLSLDAALADQGAADMALGSDAAPADMTIEPDQAAPADIVLTGKPGVDRKRAHRRIACKRALIDALTGKPVSKLLITGSKRDFVRLQPSG